MQEEQPVMTTIANRPTMIQAHLASSAGVLVQCRLPTGVDTFIPFTELFAVYEREMMTKSRVQGRL